MRFVADESVNEDVPEEFSERGELSEEQRRFLAWLDDNIGLVKKEGYSSKRLMIKFLSDNHDLLRDDVDWDSLRAAATTWYGKNLSATESVDTTPDKELEEEFVKLKGLLKKKGYDVMIDQSDFYPSEFMVIADIPEEIEKITEICQEQLNVDVVRSCDLSKYFGLGIVVFRFQPQNIVPAGEDCGGGAAGGASGGAAGAPGFGCGTSGIGGAASSSGNVGGVPATIGALEIPSPVLPKKKKKKGSSEAIEEPVSESHEEFSVADVRDTIPAANKNGDCFQAAWRAFYQNLSSKALLVHGIITGQGPIEGINYNHAWVEIGEIVIDKTIPLFAKGFPRDAYYRLARVQEDKLFKYTAKDVAEKAQQFQTYGPWEDVLWQYP